MVVSNWRLVHESSGPSRSSKIYHSWYDEQMKYDFYSILKIRNRFNTKENKKVDKIPSFCFARVYNGIS